MSLVPTPGASSTRPGTILHLVALIVRDYGPAIRFFVDVLGFELIEDSPSRTNDGRPGNLWDLLGPDMTPVAH